MTLAFRRWRRSPPADGSSLRTSIGGEGRLLRIELGLAGEDPRLALRERLPSSIELDALVARLARTDATSAAPWTGHYLRLIAGQPGVVSTKLARQADVAVPLFKRRVRQLKELGLTESLEIGYRLSPRGRAVLDRLVRVPPRV